MNTQVASDLDILIDHVNRRGWNIFPIKSNDKTPLVSWQQFQNDVTVTEDMVRDWYDEFPGCNWAAACGRISDFVVLDIDGEIGQQMVQRWYPDTFSTKTFMQKSPKGWHMFFKWPGRHVQCHNGIMEKVDIKADGGYIVISPSKINQQKYSIVVDEAMAQCPEWIIESKGPQDIREIETVAGTDMSQSPYWVTRLLASGSPEGKRNEDAARLVGYFHSRQIGKDIIAQLMNNWAQMCKPPFDARELQSVIRSVTSYQQRARAHGILEPPTMTPGGTGIKFAWHELSVEIYVSRMEEHSVYGLVAQIEVRTQNIPGVPKYLYGPIDLSIKNGQQLSNLVAQCESRMQGPPWKQIINDMARLSISHFSTGPDWTLLREAPRTKDFGFAHKPLLLQRQPTLWFASGGGLKSYLALALGVSMETGLDLGLGKPTQRNHVAYLDWEWDINQHAKRLDTLIRPEDQDKLGVNIMYRNCGGRTLRKQVDELKRLINDEGITYVIIDSAAPACGRASDNDDVVMFFQALSQLQVGSLILAHVTKSDRQAGEDVTMAFGGVQWENQARSTWHLRKQQTEDSPFADITLTHHKINAGARQSPVAVRFSFPEEFDIDGLVRIEQMNNVYEGRYTFNANPQPAAKSMALSSLRDRILSVMRPDVMMTLAEIGYSLNIDDPYVLEEELNLMSDKVFQIGDDPMQDVLYGLR